MIKRYTLFMLILSAFAEIMVFCACSGQKMRCVTGTNNLGQYYILEFEKTFKVIVPEDGDYRITVNAKHASGFVEVYARREKSNQT